MSTEQNNVPTCQKCGSTERIIPDAQILASDNTAPRVVVHAYPEALMFKGTVSAPPRVQICCDCGHIELSVINRPSEPGTDELWAGLCRIQKRKKT